MDTSDEKAIIDAVHSKIVHGHSYFPLADMCRGVVNFSLLWTTEQAELVTVGVPEVQELSTISARRMLTMTFYPVPDWEKVTKHLDEIIYVDMGHSRFIKDGESNLWKQERFTARVRLLSFNVDANSPITADIELAEVPDPLQIVPSMNCP